MKILIVDDSAATLDTFVALFEMSGHVAYPALNAKSALAHLDQRPEINLVIVDYCMPGEDGMVFCQKVRALGYRMPILMLSAVVGEMIDELRQKCNVLGNAMVLRKPVDPESLLTLISTIKAGGPDSTIIKRI